MRNLRTYIDQSLFFLGTLLTCLSILSATNFQRTASAAQVENSKQDSAQHALVADIQIPVHNEVALCEDPVAAELSSGFQTPSAELKTREGFNSAAFESPILLQSALEKIFSRPNPTDQSCIIDDAVEISVDLSPSILSLT